MKKILFLFLLIFITSSIEAQVSLDSVAYKAFRVSTYMDGVRRDFNSDVLFYIDYPILISSAEGQTKKLQMKSNPRTLEMELKLSNVQVECYDNGGYRCTLTIIYQEKTDTYGIIIEYSNVMFFYQCKLSDERPWDNDPIEYEPLETPGNPIYTKEEIKSSINKMKEEIIKIFK